VLAMGALLLMPRTQLSREAEAEESSHPAGVGGHDPVRPPRG
jgi:hypothetical protein